MQNRPFRSLLFVPAGKPDWMAKATRFGADAYVLDLEDAVTEENKPAARGYAREAIPTLAEQGVGVFVRINGLDTDHWIDDLEAVCVKGLTGVVPPKVEGPETIISVSSVMETFERRQGLEVGSIDIQALIETAPGIEQTFEVCKASPRVRSAFGGVARDGDVNREVGFHWTADGKETLYLRSKILLAARAARCPYPITGTWIDIQDLEGFERYAIEGRDLGYTGMYVIHPSHVEIANRVFTPSAEEIARMRKILTDLEAAENIGNGAVKADGAMIDKAMELHARAFLKIVDDMGIEQQPAVEAS